MSSVRTAIRNILRTPAFVASVALTLAIGISATTAICSLANAILWRSLPVRDPSRLVGIGTAEAQGRIGGLLLPVVDRLHDERLLSGSCGFIAASVVTELRGRMEPTTTELYTGECFDTLGVRAAAGRLLTGDDLVAGAPQVAVLSHEAWTHVFGGRLDVVGQRVNVDGAPYTIVGVAEKGFTGLRPGFPAALFAPLGNFAAGLASYFPPRAMLPASVIGRLLPGSTVQELDARVRARWPTWLNDAAPAQVPPPQRDRILSSRPYVFEASMGVDPSLRRRFAQPLTTLIVLAFVVLAMSGVSAGNLLLARAAGRRQEIAIRVALGASRAALLRDALVECAVLLGLALVAAWLAGSWIATALVTVFKSASPGFDVPLGADWRVVAISVAAAAAVLLVAGLLPAWWLSRVEASEVRTHDARVVVTYASARRLAVAAQLALAVPLVSVALVLWQTVGYLRHAPLGFVADDVISAQLSAVPGGYGPGLDSDTYYRTLLDRIAQQARTGDVALSYNAPLAASVTASRVGAPGGTVDVDAERHYVTPEFFKTMRIPFVRGETFAARLPGSRSVIVTESLARTVFGGEDRAVGQSLELRSSPSAPLRVVGIVRDVVLSSPQAPSAAVMFLSFWEAPPAVRMYPTLIVRTGGGASASFEALNETVVREGHEYISQVRTLDERREAALVQERLLAMVGEAFGGFGLSLSAIGLYGLVTLFALSRRREISVRMAIGARPSHVARLIVGDALPVCAVGALVGVAGSIVAARMLAGAFPLAGRYVISATSIAVVVSLAIVSLATFRPIWIGLSVDPSASLRSDT